MKNIIFTLLALVVVIFTSCKGDTPELLKEKIAPDYLMGKWMIFEAMRDDEPTLSLDRAEINFISKDSLFSNLFESGKVISYTFLDRDLNVSSIRKDFHFEVEKIGHDSILIEGKVGRSDMKMYFLKLK